MALFVSCPPQYRPAAEYQPGYDGLPVGGKRLPPNTRPFESRAEWQSHSSGRRVVAASVPVSSRRRRLAEKPRGGAEIAEGYENGYSIQKREDGMLPLPVSAIPASPRCNLEFPFKITVRPGTGARSIAEIAVKRGE